MFPQRSRGWLIAAGLTALVGTPSLATNGYVSHGYGTGYKALAGAGAALPLGPMASATNPGALAFVEPGYELSVSMFIPQRRYTVIGDPTPNPDLDDDGVPDLFGLEPGTYESGSETFFIPSLAASWFVNEDETMSLGVTLYGHGGMNTDYATGTFDPASEFPGTSPTGVDLQQGFAMPTLSLLVDETHGFGVSPVMAWQRFEATGLDAFGALGFSSSPDELTANEHDAAIGYGVRIGYLGEWLDWMSFGASWQSRIGMGEFDDYAGLFAEAGDFDIPSSWTAGIALGFSGMGFAVDVQQVRYSDVAAVGNPLLPNLQQSQLGMDSGAGFGWDDMTVVKAGGWYRTNAGWMIRAGYSHGDQPIPESEVLFNILAPGVIERHLTLGLSRPVGLDKELSVVVTRALPNTVRGPNPLEMAGRQAIELEMDQWEVSVGLAF